MFCCQKYIVTLMFRCQKFIVTLMFRYQKFIVTPMFCCQKFIVTLMFRCQKFIITLMFRCQKFIVTLMFCCQKFIVIRLFQQTRNDDLVLCPDGKMKCSEGQTCCKGFSGDYCCPLPDAICCPDKLHCCPYGYTCNPNTAECDNGTAVVQIKCTLISKVDKIKCPDNKQSSCNHGNILQDWLKKGPSVSSVMCPDGQSECMDGQTCCPIDGGKYGCCPIADVRSFLFCLLNRPYYISN